MNRSKQELDNEALAKIRSDAMNRALLSAKENEYELVHKLDYYQGVICALIITLVVMLAGAIWYGYAIAKKESVGVEAPLCKQIQATKQGGLEYTMKIKP